MDGADIVTALRAVLPEDCVLTREEERRPYECDGLTAFRRLPQLVALPRTEEQVRQVLHHLPPSGGAGGGARRRHGPVGRRDAATSRACCCRWRA